VQSLSCLDQRPGPHGGRRSGQPRLAAGVGHERQRLGVPLGDLSGHHRHPRRPPSLHPGRQTPDERLRRARAADLLEECWKPAFARYLIPKRTGLKLDLERYLRSYNAARTHTGRWTNGRTHKAVLGKAKPWHNKR
jgi:hypothetical protein